MEEEGEVEEEEEEEDEDCLVHAFYYTEHEYTMETHMCSLVGGV